MKQTYDITKINKLTFESKEMADFFANTNEYRSFRLSQQDIDAVPTMNIKELRIRLSILFNDRLNRSYPRLEMECGIKRDTFQKILRLKNGRTITYNFLAKFCLGTRLSTQEAKELFSLMGHDLSKNNRCDYILLCELNNNGTIEDYDKDMKEFGYGGIFTKAD